ncbi:MAG TPA: molybdopterin-binding/glycosyltransferase family 2 protein [Rhizomicrobium sp.]|jgi:molybdenum cofactor cytidylyltransferase
MQFGSCPVGSAQGAILAHSVRADGQLLKKGRVLSSDDIALLLRSSHSDVMVARLEQNDVPENEAAERIASLVANDTVRVGAAFTGRCNLYALADGLVLIDEAALIALNAIDESITLATVAAFSRASAKQMLGTVKIIPFAAPRAAVEQAERLLAEGPILRLAPFLPRRMALISTFLPDTKPSLLDKNRSALEARIKSVGSQIVFERRVAHTTQAVAGAIGEAREAADTILIFGASAITDRRDVIPAALEAAGGRIERFGMPVDPGNLLLLGKIADTTVVGLPGCARSPKLNGFDFVLWRLAAGVPIAAEDIARMAAGGLLTEIASRPQPRDERPVSPPGAPEIAAILLAAGLSSRMGANKLLSEIDGKPLVRHVAEAAAGSSARPVIVVTGNDAKAVESALQGLPVQFANNPDFAKGLSESLKRGLKALPESCDGAVVLLGDMPGVTSALIDKLIAAFAPEESRAICVAARAGKRGNPVLWARRFFPEMMALEGDVGARGLIGSNGELVCEVDVGGDDPLTDIDTPDDLAAYRGRQP